MFIPFPPESNIYHNLILRQERISAVSGNFSASSHLSIASLLTAFSNSRLIVINTFEERDIEIWDLFLPRAAILVLEMSGSVRFSVVRLSFDYGHYVRLFRCKTIFFCKDSLLHSEPLEVVESFYLTCFNIKLFNLGRFTLSRIIVTLYYNSTQDDYDWIKVCRIPIFGKQLYHKVYAFRIIS